ncbi:hypothetical protein HID58_086663, partial [Brassica napus]
LKNKFSPNSFTKVFHQQALVAPAPASGQRRRRRASAAGVGSFISPSSMFYFCFTIVISLLSTVRRRSWFELLQSGETSVCKGVNIVSVFSFWFRSEVVAVVKGGRSRRFRVRLLLRVSGLWSWWSHSAAGWSLVCFAVSCSERSPVSAVRRAPVVSSNTETIHGSGYVGGVGNLAQWYGSCGVNLWDRRRSGSRRCLVVRHVCSSPLSEISFSSLKLLLYGSHAAARCFLCRFRDCLFRVQWQSQPGLWPFGVWGCCTSCSLLVSGL